MSTSNVIPPKSRAHHIWSNFNKPIRSVPLIWLIIAQAVVCIILFYFDQRIFVPLVGFSGAIIAYAIGRSENDASVLTNDN